LIEFQKEFEFLSKNNYTQKNFDKSSAAPLYFNKKIEAKNINFNYNNSKFGINNVSLEIRKNEFIGFCGKTGSGKTTLVDIISGLYEPSSGDLFVDGIKVDAKNINLFKSKIGYVPQDIYLGNNSIEEVITIGESKENINKESLILATKKADIFDFIKSLPDGFQTICGDKGVRLSGGQKQRVGIARALYKEPEIIIFDESTSALDYFTENKIINTILDLKGKVTLIMVTHRLETLRACDNIFVISNGKIVSQGLFENLERTENIFKNHFSKN
jgi:ABC-type bacteriocin/lantibiotic exporter with double-glycine peptidase domain